MNIKRTGLSTMGYAIVLVIILGVVMIISAPMMADKYNNDKKEQEQQQDNSDTELSETRDYYENNLINITEEIHNIENRLTSRIDDLEMRQNQMQQSTSAPPSEPVVSDKYICEIEGVKNEYGNTVPLNPDMDISSQRIVFVCEYRR